MENIIACGFVQKSGPIPHAFPAVRPERFVEMGIRNFEIFWHEGLTVDRIRKVIDKHGFRIASIQVPCDVDDDAFYDVFRDFGGRAVALNCTRLFASIQPKRMPFDKVCERLRRLGDMLAKDALVLGMETHPPLCNDGKTILQTITAVDHPNIRVNFDTGNVHYYNKGLRETDQLALVARYVSSVHLKDTKGGFHDFSFPVLGRGIVDFPQVFGILCGAAFAGPYTLELEGLPTLDTEENIAATIQSCVDYLVAHGLMERGAVR